jgi:hypothetical protein
MVLALRSTAKRIEFLTEQPTNSKPNWTASSPTSIPNWSSYQVSAP